jgi:hypothetical protein
VANLFKRRCCQCRKQIGAAPFREVPGLVLPGRRSILWHESCWQAYVSERERVKSQPSLFPGAEFRPKPPRSSNVLWYARRYRYPDGRTYRSDIYCIYAPNQYGTLGIVGGAVLTRSGKTLAYIGPLPPTERIREIVTFTRTHVWGTDLREALQKLKDAYPYPHEVLEDAVMARATSA